MPVAELVRRVEEGWRPFRGAVGARRDALDERTSTGWRLRDLVAHVVGWEGETARRLTIFRIDGVRLEPFLGTDALNAESVARYGRMSVPLLLDELDRTHDALVHEVRTLSDDELLRNDAWAELIVAANTFDHYAEHAAEIAAS